MERIYELKKYVKKDFVVDKINDKEKIINILNNIYKLFFMGYLERIDNLDKDFERLISDVKDNLRNELKKVDCNKEIDDYFLDNLPNVREKLELDLEAIMKHDPAARSYIEIIMSYPGIYAIFIHRLAHLLYIKKVPIIPRIMSEYAHEKTGIDIHPGAEIGQSFFIDHGTGIVIGETTTIGNNVKIYQGVTLGAKSLSEGYKLRDQKRHPTILDNVTIYSNATILGGNTIIGNNVIIGASVFITKSVKDNIKVLLKNYDYIVMEDVSND